MPSIEQIQDDTWLWEFRKRRRRFRWSLIKWQFVVWLLLVMAAAGLLVVWLR